MKKIFHPEGKIHLQYSAFSLLNLHRLWVERNSTLNRPVKKHGHRKTYYSVALLLSLMLSAQSHAGFVEIGGLVVLDASSNSSTSFSYTATQNGRLVFNMDNPDGSADGQFNAFFGRANYRNINTSVLANSTSPSGSAGLFSSGFSIAVTAGELLTLDLSYGSAVGTDNTGTDTLSVLFDEDDISTAGATFLGSFNPNPQQQGATQVFNLNSTGEIIIDATQTGTFGGGDFVYYIDGIPYGLTQTRVNGDTPTQSYLAAIAIAGGNHTFQLGHEDPFFGDNNGVKSADIYFNSVPVPTTLVLFGSALVCLVVVKVNHNKGKV